VVADTNTVVSGLLWWGAPRQLLDLARNGAIQLFTSAALLVELEEVLGRDKFKDRLQRANTTPQELILGYSALAQLVEPSPIEPVVLADADDDVVLSCAVAAAADAVVSGDSHLLRLRRYREIPILAPAQLIARATR
jgi:uncharacterized protein